MKRIHSSARPTDLPDRSQAAFLILKSLSIWLAEEPRFGLACFHTIQSQRWLMVARVAPIPYANCLHVLPGRKRFENRNDRRRVSFLRRPMCRSACLSASRSGLPFVYSTITRPQCSFPPIILRET
ncbi:hypothetical protein DTO207G8_6241 [Paecilomyces variotii]|nr:hypothetical protein DTO207G8_6241 [Paecilomyces variotii]KAJ9360405.1 hypothetical protein DTO027B9_1389 [Paecilomyces variotii]KAJ9406746.1 hypothetical protein DTO045G8_5412 [Paecilomyces variotii]